MVASWLSGNTGMKATSLHGRAQEFSHDQTPAAFGGVALNPQAKELRSLEIYRLPEIFQTP